MITRFSATIYSILLRFQAVFHCRYGSTFVVPKGLVHHSD